MTIQQQDNRWPDGSSNRSDDALDRSRRLCRKIARSHYENFLVATLFLPRRLHQPFHDLYAFCRTADDLADHSPSTAAALAGLARYQSRIDAIFADRDRGPARHDGPDATGPDMTGTDATGTIVIARGGATAVTDVGPRGPQTTQAESADLFVALRDTIERFALPRAPFDDLLTAFRRDQTQTRYASRDELIGYCRCSADPVGRLVLGLAGACTPENAALSDKICTGLQWANFWQDVARDYRLGRVYLPGDAMQRFGVDESMLATRPTPQPLRRLIAELCDETEAMFRSGSALADRVPRWLATDVNLFAAGGLATLAAIRRIDCDVISRRVTVGRWQRIRLLGRAMIGL